MTFRILLVALAATLAGCATHAPGLDADTLRAIRAEGVHSLLSEEAAFHERTKGKVVAVSALAVGTAVLAGGWVHVSARNQLPTDGYLDTGAWKSIFNQAEAASFDAPAKAMEAAVRRRLVSQGIAQNPGSRYTVESSSAFWGVDYEKLTEQDNYRLYFHLALVLKQGNETLRDVRCQGVTLEKRGYDDWMANDRARIRSHVAAIGDSCASRLLAQLELTAAEPQPLVSADTP